MDEGISQCCFFGTAGGGSRDQQQHWLLQQSVPGRALRPPGGRHR